MSEQEWEDKLAEVQKHSEHWYNKYKELENQNRLLGERCNQLLKDKGELTDQIADIKANCDLAIEGRDIKIKELEQENEKLKSEKGCETCTKFDEVQLTKAKELLERLVTVCKIVPLGTNYDVVKKAEQFLKEIEK